MCAARPYCACLPRTAAVALSAADKWPRTCLHTQAHSHPGIPGPTMKAEDASRLACCCSVWFITLSSHGKPPKKRHISRLITLHRCSPAPGVQLLLLLLNHNPKMVFLNTTKHMKRTICCNTHVCQWLVCSTAILIPDAPLLRSFHVCATCT